MKENLNTYLSMMMNESEEETSIVKQINAENEKFEETDAYKEHKANLDGLYCQLRAARLYRLDEAKKYRPKRLKPKRTGSGKKKEISEELKSSLELSDNLSASEKRILSAKINDERVEVDSEHLLPENKIDELHVLLVQTVLDYIKENNLTDVWSVAFSADSLQESAEYGEWCPATDSYLRVEGLREEEVTDVEGEKRKIPYRVIIGEQW